MLFHSVLLFGGILIQIITPPPAVEAIFLIPPYIFSTSTRAPTNNSAGSFTSNISFDTITNVSNVVVAVSQNMGGRSLDLNSETGRRINSSVFLYRDGEWNKFNLRKKRSLFDLGNTLTQQVFEGVSDYLNNRTANNSQWIQDILNSSQPFQFRISRHAKHGEDTFLSDDFVQYVQLLRNVIRGHPSADRIINGLVRELNSPIMNGVRGMRNDLTPLIRAINSTSRAFQQLFKMIYNQLESEKSSNNTCWHNKEPDLRTAFQESLQDINQCMTRELNEAVVLAQNLTDNIRSPIQLPLELAKQLQECIPRGFVDSTEAALCVSEIPFRFSYFAVERSLYIDNLLYETRQVLAYHKLAMVTCGLTGRDTVSSIYTKWIADFKQCLQNGTDV